MAENPDSLSDRGGRGALQAAHESLADYPAIVAMHEEQTERAEAECDRLKAENERLRETLKALGPSFPSHHIDSEKGGRWIEYGDGDGYWDDGDVHTEDCPACALSRRIDEALGLSGSIDDKLAACPDCDGTGHGDALGDGSGYIPCGTCAGTGQIDAEDARRYRANRAALSSPRTLAPKETE